MPRVPKRAPTVHLVFWEDILDHAGWNSAEELSQMDTSLCISVGFVVRKTKKAIYLTETISPESENEPINKVLVIPLGCVLKIKKLTVR